MVPVPGLSTLQGRELSCQATRATQKVKEAESMWSKSKGKGKGKGKANDKLVDEAWRGELEILKAKGSHPGYDRLA
jgi:hypothetical protein